MEYSYRMKTFSCADTTISVRSMDKINICYNDGYDFARTLILDGGARLAIYTQDPADTDSIVNGIFDEFCISPEIPVQLGYLLDNQDFNKAYILNSFIETLVERTKNFYDVEVFEHVGQIDRSTCYFVTLDIYAQQKGLPMEFVNTISLKELEELEAEDLDFDEVEIPMNIRATRRRRSSLAKAYIAKNSKYWYNRTWYDDDKHIAHTAKNSSYDKYVKRATSRLIRHMPTEDIISKGTAYKKLLVK